MVRRRLIPQSPPNPNDALTQALIPRTLTEALALAETLAKATFVPDHLRGKPGDCLLVVMQAQRWGMDALNVAQCTSVVRGKLCYEGKLVAAVLYSMGAVEGRLRYSYTGSGQQRTITVTGRCRGKASDDSISGSVESWKTDNGNWKKDPDSMLVYRGTRQWARLFAPEALLGVYTPDELDDAPAEAATAVVMPRARSAVVVPDLEALAPREPEQAELAPEPEPAAAPAVAGTSPEPGAPVTGECGIHLPENMRKVLYARQKATGTGDEALLAEFPSVNAANINAVLAWLRGKES